ncbi:MAG: hypothetical protein WC830_09530 [Burkholderiales bacterium]|jgi:hypothetical protein
MKRHSIFVFAALLALPAAAQSPADGPSLLFKNRGEQLSPDDKSDIFEQLDLEIAENGQKLVDSICGEVEFEVELVDLNKDKVPEVFVSGGNTCTAGSTGTSIWLFIKDSAGRYRQNLGFPTAGYTILKTRSKGFPDLRFGGPGFCFGVWRWNGSEYQHWRNHPMEKGGCDSR